MYKEGWASCSCDPMCLVYEDCCWDFHDVCTADLDRYQRKSVTVHDAKSICHDGYTLLTYRSEGVDKRQGHGLTEAGDMPGLSIYGKDGHVSFCKYVNIRFVVNVQYRGTSVMNYMDKIEVTEHFKEKR
ncbi:hypothetical protein ElyMa_004618100 [Elysia marginata]|uniref:SMB domain-containing protein n=1 Tax=Elysia marginata TaxID=1093978 RepID=A0AAV4I032_9GAST|nr:hypothetical protein ElyMa_004618100 [Elysia marginata]